MKISIFNVNSFETAYYARIAAYENGVLVASIIVSFDSNNDSYRNIISPLSANTDNYLLVIGGDGMKQIRSLLSEYRNLDCIQFISDGSSGKINIGNSILTTSNLFD